MREAPDTLVTSQRKCWKRADVLQRESADLSSGAKVEPCDPTVFQEVSFIKVPPSLNIITLGMQLPAHELDLGVKSYSEHSTHENQKHRKHRQKTR